MTTSIYSVDEARRRARRLLPKVVFDFIEGGADDELTTKANRRAFDRILFRPLTGVDVGEPDLRTTVLGTELSLPVLLAPCGGLSMFHPDGQAGAARAAATAHTIAVVGTLSGSLLEKGMSEGGGAPHWFQLYKLGGRAGAERLVDRAAKAGYRTLVVSVDTPVVGHKERDIRNGGVRPGGTPAIDRVDLASMIRSLPTRAGCIASRAQAFLSVNPTLTCSRAAAALYLLRRPPRRGCRVRQPGRTSSGFDAAGQAT